MSDLKEKYFSNKTQAQQYAGFVFDLDGTLLDSKTDIVKATNATLVAMGVDPLSDAVIESYVGHGVRDLIGASLKQVPSVDLDLALQFFSNYYMEHATDNSRFFEGAIPFLRKLKSQNKKVALLTNKPQNYTEVILKALNVEKDFDRVLGANAGFALKPDISGLNDILSQWQLSPNQVLYFGDSCVDSQTAQTAGMDLALYLKGFAVSGELNPYYDYATLAFNDYNQLSDYF